MGQILDRVTFLQCKNEHQARIIDTWEAKSLIRVRLAMRKSAPRVRFQRPGSETLDRGAIGDANGSTALTFSTFEWRNPR